MAAVAGKGGEIKIGANTVAEVQEWSLDIESEMLDTTAMLAGGTTWKTFIAGLNGWTVSVEFKWDMSDTNGQKAFQDAILAGSSVASVELYTNASNYYTGTVLLSAQNVATSVSDTVNGSQTLQGTGALTYN